MIKDAPGIGSIIVMGVFTFSCFALILFTWLAFGGSVPLKPEGYRLNVALPEAVTLATEVEVRMAGVDIGKVKKLSLEQGATRTLVEMELEDEYAPVPSDTRAILRQKTILGETFVELSQGSPVAPKLPENGKLPDGQVEETVQIDEIQRIFDNPTKRGLRHARARARGHLRGWAQPGPERRDRQPARRSPATARACSRCSTPRSARSPTGSATRASCSTRSTAARAS